MRDKSELCSQSDGVPLVDSHQHLFSIIVLPHLDSAYRFAFGFTGSAADAEDVVQEACIRAFKGIHGYAGGSARAWLLAIVRSAALTYLAKNRSHARMIGGESDEFVRALDAYPDPGPGPEAGLIAQADSVAVERALATLPTTFREILILREYDGLSYREIAEVTQAPIGTVMSRLARARALMLKALTPDTPGSTLP